MDWLMGKSKAKPNGKKPAAEEKKVYLEPEYTKARVTDFAFKELVVLPREIDLNEWLASNTTTFFHHVNLQYSTISEFCTGEACQTMAVCNTQYHWYDERGRKVKCTAPQYVDFVMSSVQKLVTDEDVFPTKYGTCSTCWPTSTRPTSRRRWPWSCTPTSTRSTCTSSSSPASSTCSTPKRPRSWTTSRRCCAAGPAGRGPARAQGHRTT
ncbi:MOB kinase activator 2 isoform X2 [Sorex fumeus]|uniref:MOB kinase activator 2 isoform X2 n=1 Tax=Sorex fumeus TaxID=62283 RepID=UPI0024ADE82A|nr:MOB kinase activator 2 isoform X2 [Sorex fumeus]